MNLFDQYQVLITSNNNKWKTKDNLCAHVLKLNATLKLRVDIDQIDSNSKFAQIELDLISQNEHAFLSLLYILFNIKYSGSKSTRSCTNCFYRYNSSCT